MSHEGITGTVTLGDGDRVQVDFDNERESESMNLRKEDRVVREGITGTVTVVDEPRGRVRVDFDNDAIGFFDPEGDVQLTFITTSDTSSKWAQAKDCLGSFREMHSFRDKFVSEHAGWAGDEPSCGYVTWDAAMADYNEDLIHLGELLADPVAEALGVKPRIAVRVIPLGTNHSFRL